MPRLSKKKKVIKNHRQHHLSVDFNSTRLRPFRFPYHAQTNLLPSFVNTIFAQVNSNLIHTCPSMFEIEIYSQRRAIEIRQAIRLVDNIKSVGEKERADS